MVDKSGKHRRVLFPSELQYRFTTRLSDGIKSGIQLQGSLNHAPGEKREKKERGKGGVEGQGERERVKGSLLASTVRK